MKCIIRLMVLLAAAAQSVAGMNAYAQDDIPQHPWNGSRVAIFGDSISDPRVNNGQEKWWWYMKEDIGIVPLVYAHNGREWDNVLIQAGRLLQEHGQDFEAIMILMGTNDFNRGIPTGEWYRVDSVRVMAAAGEPKSLKTRLHRTVDFNPDTFRGRISIALDSLKRMFPHKQIVLLTPLHRGYADFGDSNVQPDETYCNSCGEFIDAYVDALKEAGNVWAVPVIDLNALSGLFPMHREQMDYFPGGKDELHPSDEGHRRMALALEAYLRCLAPRF